MAKNLASMNIGIFGPGAIGSLLAALFDRSGKQVYCFGAEQALESIHKHGIQIKSSVYGDFTSRPISTSTSSSVVDLLFLTVKSPALKNSLRAMRNCVGENTIIVTLLNGIGHRELIRDVYGNKLVVGTIGAVEVFLDADRVVQHSSRIVPHLEIASDHDIKPENLSEIASLIESAGLSVTVGKSENEVIWRKLIRLCAISTMTASTDLPIGKIRTDSKLREHLKLLVEELCSVGLTQGIVCLLADVMRQIDALPEDMTTSMQRDINLARISEIESILGKPIRLGKLLGLSLPTMEQSYLTLKSKIAIEQCIQNS
jgi:2-dehydropantoate 2-reductase